MKWRLGAMFRGTLDWLQMIATISAPSASAHHHMLKGQVSSRILASEMLVKACWSWYLSICCGMQDRGSIGPTAWSGVPLNDRENGVKEEKYFDRPLERRWGRNNVVSSRWKNKVALHSNDVLAVDICCC